MPTGKCTQLRFPNPTMTSSSCSQSTLYVRFTSGFISHKYDLSIPEVFVDHHPGFSRDLLLLLLLLGRQGMTTGTIVTSDLSRDLVHFIASFKYAGPAHWLRSVSVPNAPGYSFRNTLMWHRSMPSLLSPLHDSPSSGDESIESPGPDAIAFTSGRDN